MADVCDEAAAYQERANLEAISGHRGRMQRGGKILKWCRQCGEEIAPARREAARKIGMACELCIICQTELEKS